jgi:hypothetical protein
MATTSTTRLGLVKPTPGTGEPVDVQEHLNDNWDRVDAAIIQITEAPLSLLDSRVNATMDGTDDSDQFNTALALLPEDGGDIYVPPGILGLSEHITLPDNTKLVGSGAMSTTIRPAGSYTGEIMSVSFGCTVSQIGFDGQDAAGPLLTVRGARCMLSQLYIQNSASSGLQFIGTGSGSDSAHAAKVTDVSIIGCASYGVFVGAWAYDQEFLNLWIGECNVGIRIENSDCLFNNLHVWGCTGNGVEVRGNRNHFQNVYSESNGNNGIDVFNAVGAQVIGGALWNNDNHGISIANNRVLVQGMTITENDGNGVNGGNVLYGQVIGCQFHDADTPSRQNRPVVTTGTSNYWIVVGNVLRSADHVTGGNSLVGANNQVANNIT